MESKFIPTLQAGNGYTYLSLKGILDEDNLLANLLSQIQGRLLLIDMAEIERINSCGVRDWVNWLNQIQALGVSVILLRCSPVVVSQANMVANFAADAFIHSFYAPYVHPDTGDEQTVLLFTEDIRQNQPVHAPKIYNENGEELEFDEFEESYFAFVSDPRIMNYQVSPDVQAVIQYYLPEAATRQPVVGQRSQAQQPYMSQVSQAAQPMRSGMMPSQGGYGQPGCGPQGGYGQPSPYSGVMNPAAGPRNPMGMQRPGGYPQQSPYGQQGPQSPYGQQGPQSPYGQQGPQSQYGQRPIPMPQAAQPMRHEQPPIPSSSGYQQVPSALPPQQPNRMPPVAQNRMQPVSQMNPAGMQPAPVQPNVAPQPEPMNEEPKPAPQAVSSLAMQSMARMSPAAQKIEDSAQQNPSDAAGMEPAQNHYPQTAYPQQPYQNGFAQEPSVNPDLLKQKKIFYIIAITGVILIIILVVVLISKAA